MNSGEHNQKKAVIIGAGPAGLTAAYQLLEETDIVPVVCEESDYVGGISRTVRYHGNRMDIGGHRFFSKSKEVTDWWNKMMPLQGFRSKDDILLELNDKELSSDGPDPEKENLVMLIRHRVSRIFFLRKFFDYPISMKVGTFTNMGVVNTLKAGFGYLYSCVHKVPETNLENFYINRFGKPLYRMFFEGYTEKVWGLHPSLLGADWGSQRVKGLSVGVVLKDMVNKALGRKTSENSQTSLIEKFVYPKYGPGQLWERVAELVTSGGGQVRMKTSVRKINVKDGGVESVEVISPDGTSYTVECDYVISSMPIKDLISSLSGIEIPGDVKSVSESLPYRDFITAGICVRKMKIGNQTGIKTYQNRVPDTWIYVQERDVRMGRIQIFNNWSPYLVKDYENTMWIGLEYFCSEGDDLWTMKDDEFIRMAVDELVKIDVIDRDDVMDACRINVKKAYPAYFGSYYQLDKVKKFLTGIDRLYCVGRNGQHRYNNMDHSMLTAMECVHVIKDGGANSDRIWNVNTEKEYHEKAGE